MVYCSAGSIIEYKTAATAARHCAGQVPGEGGDEVVGKEEGLSERAVSWLMTPAGMAEGEWPQKGDL